MTDPNNEGGVDPSRLEDIQTRWSLLDLAHQAPSSVSGPARAALVLRYSAAIRRYVQAIVRDADDAEDLTQDVVVRLLKGDFAGADPTRGRFRDLLKVAVRNMVRNFWAKQKRRRAKGQEAVEEIADEQSAAPVAGGEDEWEESWRRSLLDLAWSALDAYERQSEGNVFYTLLRLRTDHPDDDGKALAARLEEATGRSVTPTAMRQQLRRARLRFAQLLVEEIARGLEKPSPEAVEDELAELGLMEHVTHFLPDDWRTRGELR